MRAQGGWTDPAKARWKRGALAAWLALVASSGQAQLSLHAQDIELKNLDLHPRPSRLRETGTVVYGAIELGLILQRTPSDPTARLAELGPSFIGVRSVEMLGGGWQVHTQLEHGVDAARGSNANPDGLAFDRALTVGFGHRRWGRIDFGRRDHPAYGVALSADPWRGTGVASAGDGRLYPRPVDAAGSAPVGSSYRVRAPQALTYRSPEHLPLWVELQASVSRNAAGPPGQAPDADEREVGAALHWRQGGLHAAIGYQRWNRDSQAWPLSLAYEFLTWTGTLGLGSGRLATGRYLNLSVGASFRDQHGPRPGEWRIGLHGHRTPQGTRLWKLGAGRVWPLSRRTQIEAEGGLEDGATGSSRFSAGLGIRHQFSW